MARNDNSDAEIADYTRAIELDPSNIYAYRNRGKCYESRQIQGKAIADYQQVLKLKPDHPQAQEMRDYIARWEK
jgi:tetratricopeptide (TPR) repeat protein